jgi:hypothetical protein
MNEINDIIRRIENTIVNAGTGSESAVGPIPGMTNALIEPASAILAALLMVMLVYHLTLTWLGEDWALTQVNLFQLLLKWGIIVFLLANWTDIGMQFRSAFSDLASRIGGYSGYSGTSIIDLGIESIKNLFSIGKTEYDSNTPCSVFIGCKPRPLTGADSSVSPSILGGWWSILAGAANAGMIAFNAAISLVSFMAKMFAALAVVAMIFATAAVSILGSLMIMVGLTVGPILAPFLLLPPLSYLFNGWIKFMFSAGIVTLVSSVIIILVGRIFVELNKLSSVVTDGTELGINLLAIFMMTAIGALGTYLSLKAPEIAMAMVSGNQISAGGAAAGITKAAKTFN